MPAEANGHALSAAANNSGSPTVALPGQLAAPQSEDEEADRGPLADILDFSRVAPPWLISCIFHMSLVIVLGLLSTELPQQQSAPELEVGSAFDGGMEQPDFDVHADLAPPDKAVGDNAIIDGEPAAPPDGPSALFESNPVVGGAPPAPDVGALAGQGIGTFGKVDAPSLGVLLTGRGPGMKGVLLRAYGGGEKTESSVMAGLGWLARKQHAQTGTWSLVGPYADGGRKEDNAVAMGLALLAYQGAGYTPRTGARLEFRDVVAKGWKALLKKQGADGSFIPPHKRGPDRDPERDHYNFYTQAICTLALCELYAMTHDPEYHDRAQRAVDFLVKNQAPQGGWKYKPRQRSDLSVSGWVIMALESARMGGLNVPNGTLYEFERFLDSVARDGGSQYSYEPREPEASLAITAEGLLCREYLGWAQDDPRLVAGAKLLVANPVDYVNRADIYYWYYATQVLHHLGGKAWEEWNNVMSVEVPKHQVRHGAEAGSWNPGDDKWGNNGGRLYTTCLSLFMLEAYYRHLPIYANKLDLTVPAPAGAKPLPSQTAPKKPPASAGG